MLTKLKRLLLSSTSKDTIITMVGNFAVALGGTLFTVIVARSLSPDRFGVFSAIFALATLFGSLSDLGISAALVNFLPKVKNSRTTILSVTFWIQLIIAASLFAITLGFIPIRESTLPGASSVHIIYLSLLIIPLAFETFALAILKAEKRFTWVAVIMSLDSWVKLLLTYLLFRFGSLDISSILLSAIAASSLATAIGLAKELKNINPIFPKKQVMKVVDFAKWIAIVRIFSVGISRIDILLLNAVGTSFQAGIFAAASRIALLFVLLVSSLGSVVAPRFSAFATNQQVIAYIKKLTVLTLLVAVAMLSTIIFAPTIVNLVFGPAYISTVPVFRYLTLAMIPFLLSTITINPIIYYFNKPNFIAKVSILQVGTIVALDLLLIPTFGATAPAISLGIANLIVLSLTFWKIKSLLK